MYGWQKTPLAVRDDDKVEPGDPPQHGQDRGPVTAVHGHRVVLQRQRPEPRQPVDPGHDAQAGQPVVVQVQRAQVREPEQRVRQVGQPVVGQVQPAEGVRLPEQLVDQQPDVVQAAGQPVVAQQQRRRLVPAVALGRHAEHPIRADEARGEHSQRIGLQRLQVFERKVQRFGLFVRKRHFFRLRRHNVVGCIIVSSLNLIFVVYNFV